MDHADHEPGHLRHNRVVTGESSINVITKARGVTRRPNCNGRIHDLGFIRQYALPLRVIDSDPPRRFWLRDNDTEYIDGDIPNTSTGQCSYRSGYAPPLLFNRPYTPVTSDLKATTKGLETETAKLITPPLPPKLYTFFETRLIGVVSGVENGIPNSSISIAP